MRRALLTTAAIIALASVDAAAQSRLRMVQPTGGGGGGGGGTIIFQDTIQTSASSPTYGFDNAVTELEGTRWSKNYQTGVGPGGQNAVEIVSIVPSGTVPGGNPNGQHGFGWNDTVEAAFGYNAPPRYGRVSLYFPSDNTGLCDRNAADPTVTLGRCSVKFLVNAEGCATAPCRAILEMDISDEDANSGTPAVVRFVQMIDGGISQTEGAYSFAAGQWIHLQWLIDGNSGAGIADGRMALWVCTQGGSVTEGSPYIDSGAIELNTGSGSGGYWYTGYNNAEGITSGNVYKVRIGRWQVVTAFDAGWCTW